MAFFVQVIGRKRLTKKMKKMGPAAAKILLQETDKSVVNIAEDAYDRAPVDTGELRESIKWIKSKPGGIAAIVLVGAKHGLFVEFGTINMAAQPFLIPAMQKERPKLFKRVQKRMRRELGKKR